MNKPQGKKALRLTIIEEQVKNILEKAGIKTFKGSYPDFIIYDPETAKYCLVEVKRDRNDLLSAAQTGTFEMLKKIGIPCHIIHADSIVDVLELQQAMKPSPEQFLSKSERERYDALGRFDSVKAAAAYLKLSPQTLYNWMSHQKKRYRKQRGWVNATLAQTRRGGCLADLLHEKRKMEPPEEEDD